MCAAELFATAAGEALLDDLNTPVAIREMHALGRQLTQSGGLGDNDFAVCRELLGCADLLGLLQLAPQQWFQYVPGTAALDTTKIESMIAEREAAKLAKDYARADRIRQQLLEQGVVLEDSREGTRWRRS